MASLWSGIGFDLVRRLLETRIGLVRQNGVKVADKPREESHSVNRYSYGPGAWTPCRWRRNRLYVYDRYVSVLNEGTEVEPG